MGGVTLQYANPSRSDGQGLNGCWQLTASGFVPEFVYWGYPLSEAHTDLPSRDAMLMLTASELQMVFAAGENVQDPTGGIVLFSVVDCLGNPAPGVRVAPSMFISSDAPHQTEFYGKVSFSPGGGGFSPGVTPPAPMLEGPLDPSATQTGNDGSGGLLNVLPQVLTLGADPISFGGAPSSQEIIAVQAGTITVVTLVPNQ